MTKPRFEKTGLNSESTLFQPYCAIQHVFTGHRLCVYQHIITEIPVCATPQMIQFPSLFVLSTIVTLGKGAKDASLGRGRRVSLQSKEKGEPAHSSLEIRDKGALGPGGFWKKQRGLWEAGIFPFLLCATV